MSDSTTSTPYPAGTAAGALPAGAPAEPGLLDALTRSLLSAGVLAGPLFLVVLLVQLATREGFDLTRQPLSLLAVGDRGWVQAANFVVAGILSLAFAAGVARRLRSGPASRSAPWLIALFGLGLVVGGLFTADASLGFPPGAPEGIPATISAHATVHAVAPPVAFTSLVVACFVVARRFAWQGRRTAAIWTRVIAVVCFVLSIPVGFGFSIRLFLAIALAFGWLTWYASRLLQRP